MRPAGRGDNATDMNESDGRGAAVAGLPVRRCPCRVGRRHGHGGVPWLQWPTPFPQGPETIEYIYIRELVPWPALHAALASMRGTAFASGRTMPVNYVK